MAREQTVRILSEIHVHYVAFDKITKLTTEEVFLTVNDLHNIIHIVLHAWFLSRLVIPANKMGHTVIGNKCLLSSIVHGGTRPLSIFCAQLGILLTSAFLDPV